MQMMTPAAWQRTQELAGWGELGDAQRAALAIGCPVHGNASMDWDEDEVFCSRCDVEHAMAKRDAVQDARTAALDALAEANGITRGDELANEDGGIRPCERNLYGFCRTCGIDMGLLISPAGVCPGCGGDDMHAAGCGTIESNGAN